MKITVLKDELVHATSLVGRVTTSRATLPILQNILLEVEDNTLILQATNLEQTLISRINGEGFEGGKITISARLFLEYLQNNSDKSITISTNDTTIKIDSKNHHATLKGISPEDFPVLPKTTFKEETTISSESLNQIINKIIFAAASDETRPILTGLLFRFKGNDLQIVATDGYRLVYNTLPVNITLTGDYIIPKKSLVEIQRLLGESEEVILSLSSNQMQARVNSTTFTSRILEGSYPPFESRIPKKYPITITLSAATFLQDLKLASIFSRDSAFSTSLKLEKNILRITAISPVLGENSNEITVENSSDDVFNVSVNAQYFIDALQTISGDIELHFIDGSSPVVITQKNTPNYLYLVMPLRSE